MKLTQVLNMIEPQEEDNIYKEMMRMSNEQNHTMNTEQMNEQHSTKLPELRFLSH